MHTYHYGNLKHYLTHIGPTLWNTRRDYIVDVKHCQNLILCTDVVYVYVQYIT